MNYRFEAFELDVARMELRRSGTPVAAEPQVFELLQFLIEQRDRVVTKDEIVARVWNGRIVSDSAISSRIKSARQALGDSGAAQHSIRTVHGTGFRFVAAVVVVPAATASQPPVEIEAVRLEPARPSIAVLPFRLMGGQPSAIADALPQDLITELSRLRWLFVIARASTFRFRSDDWDVDRVRSALNVRYCLTGTVELLDGAMVVSVELCDTDDRGIVWSERFRVKLGAVHEIREEIVRAVINALELQIPLNEARRARLKPPSDLDAWSAYHLGLQHMYRFTAEDNAAATGLFERATQIDPEFARAYAGLSFTHFQDAFLGYSGNFKRGAAAAERFANQCLERDPVDPFGNLTMGRAMILRGDLEGGLPWLERANTLNPNYAQARYSRAWIESLLGQAKPSQVDVDSALALSPLDPLRYGMLGVRAFSHMVLGEDREAVTWADRAARAPSAHVLIELIALVAHGMAGNDEAARAWARSARVRSPDLRGDQFLRAFPFRDPVVRKRVNDTLARFGF